MNTILNGDQSDTKVGEIVLPAAVDLTGKRNYLVKISNNGGVANFALPTGVDDQAVFVVMSENTATNDVAADAPDLGENCRVAIDSTNAIVPGDMLSLSPNTFGTLYKPAAGAGAHQYTFIAEEAVAAGAVGQLCKVRRIPDRAFNL